MTSYQYHRVAVYGTLKRGQSNHGFLAGARCLGECAMTSLVLYDLGPYPGARREPSHGVLVEVYEVDQATFARLDQLEDYNPGAPATGLYDRKLMDTPLGRAWVYLYNDEVSDARAIRSGGWTARTSVW